jgi:hypothetical protein
MPVFGKTGLLENGVEVQAEGTELYIKETLVVRRMGVLR